MHEHATPATLPQDAPGARPEESPLMGLLRVAAQQPRPVARPGPVVAFDLDGTLFDVAEGEVVVDWGSPEDVAAKVVPHLAACRMVALSTGVRVAYVTGRGNVLRGVTTQQLVAAHLPKGPLLMQPGYTAADALTLFKTKGLADLKTLFGGVALFVGDSDHDAAAARLSGVPFLDAVAWRCFAEAMAEAGVEEGLPPEALAFGAAAIRLLARPVNMTARRPGEP